MPIGNHMPDKQLHPRCRVPASISDSIVLVVPGCLPM
jgi:hypothetical protein